MKWKPLTIFLAIFLVLVLAAPGMAAKPAEKPEPGQNQPADPGWPDDPDDPADDDSGPPDEPTVDFKYINMTGTVALVEDIYELKETLIVYDFDDNVWVEKLVPVDEPDALYFLTADADSACEDIEDDEGNIVTVCQVLAGEQWLLDFGPEWYAADPCLVESYICEDGVGGEIKMGPFILGDFTCSGGITTGVVSNDPEMAEGTSIPLMSRDRRDDLPYAGSIYAFGRSGGSEIVWIYDPDGDGEFELYPKAGSNIVWEIDDGGGQAWWRGEAPPQAMTSELSCDDEEVVTTTESVEVLTTSSKQKRNR